MPNVSVARRYARALLDVAAEGNALDVVEKQLSSFVSAYESNQELRDLLVNPAFSTAQRSGVVESVMKLAGVENVLLANTMRLLTERNRLSMLPDIHRQFREMADERAGRVRGRVTSAVQLTPDVLKKIEEQLERITQRDVVLEQTVDPAVLGGISAQVGSHLYDGTLRSQLEEMRLRLKA